MSDRDSHMTAWWKEIKIISFPDKDKNEETGGKGIYLWSLKVLSKSWVI